MWKDRAGVRVQTGWYDKKGWVQLALHFRRRRCHRRRALPHRRAQGPVEQSAAVSIPARDGSKQCEWCVRTNLGGGAARRL